MKRSLLSVSVWVLVCATAPAFVLGCSDAATEREAQSGTLSVALTGTGSTGKVYRLRNGTFKITGKSTATASSEDNLNAGAITLELKAGSYLATLAAGWTMEVTAPDGTFSAVKAVLVSNNPMSFEIADQLMTPVLFRFNAGDDVVQLGNGRAAIGIAVNDCGADGAGCYLDEDGDGVPPPMDCNDQDPEVSPDAPERCFNGADDNCDAVVDEGCNCSPAQGCCMPGAPEICGDGIDNDCNGMVDDNCGCSPTDPACAGQCQLGAQTGCPAGLACYLQEGFMQTECQPNGPVPVGLPCMRQADCRAPSLCASIDGVTNTCLQACNADPGVPSTCPLGQTCEPTGLLLPNGENVGGCL